MSSFMVGDNAVYPGHGVGKIKAIETKEILGSKHTFYSIEIIETGMKIMVPTNNTESVGLRPIISDLEADKVLGILRETNVKIDNQTWNRRYREYMEKIKTHKAVVFLCRGRGMPVLRGVRAPRQHPAHGGAARSAAGGRL